MKEKVKIGLVIGAALVTTPIWLPPLIVLGWLTNGFDEYGGGGYDSGGCADCGGTTTERMFRKG